jgi:protein-disulfide isomerase
MSENNKEESHERHRVSRPYNGSAIDKLRDNPWMVTSIVLALLLIFMVIFGGKIFSSTSTSQGAVSASVAENNLVEFINSQGTDKATVVSTEQENSLYKVTVEYKGQEIPVYVTLDGESLIASNPIPLSTRIDTSMVDEAPQDTNVPKSDKPKVELFIMSHCPYGTQIEKGMLPVLATLKDKVDFQLKFVYYAMHDKIEIDEQARQYCIDKEQNDKLLPYLQCFLEAGDSPSCIESIKIDETKLDACVAKADEEFSLTANYNNKASWLSGRFPLFDIHKADNDKYQIQGSPTLIINGQEVSSGRSPAALLSAVCSSFNEAPEECDTVLPTDNPSPGFGYQTASDNAAALAQCG